MNVVGCSHGKEKSINNMENVIPWPGKVFSQVASFTSSV